LIIAFDDSVDRYELLFNAPYKRLMLWLVGILHALFNRTPPPHPTLKFEAEPRGRNFWSGRRSCGNLTPARKTS